jgi:uncharacterized OsmC-like protein
MNAIDTTPNREFKVLIRAESESGTRMKVVAGKFTMTIDEPPSLGGTDAGPSPVQVLLMSLAGCLNVTGHEVARERGLALEGMRIRIEGVMNPCAFIGCSFEERAGFQKIQVTVDADMPGASREEIASWLEDTEKRCPVTDNIKADTSVEVVMAGG